MRYDSSSNELEYSLPIATFDSYGFYVFQWTVHYFDEDGHLLDHDVYDSSRFYIDVDELGYQIPIYKGTTFTNQNFVGPESLLPVNDDDDQYHCQSYHLRKEEEPIQMDEEAADD